MFGNINFVALRALIRVVRVPHGCHGVPWSSEWLVGVGSKLGWLYTVTRRMFV